ncbi:MAG: glucan 1,4-alpha-glucosidase [Terricaulis silvestris]
MKRLLLCALSLALTSCAELTQSSNVAPAPLHQAATTWAYSAKTGVGTSYEAYVDGAYSDHAPTGVVSKVWFSIADGVLTETMYGLIHEAQIKQLRFAVLTDTGLVLEGRDTDSRIEYLHVDAAGRPLSPAYRVITRDRAGRFEIEKHIFTDPDRQTLFMRVIVRALKGSVRPYLLLEPHMANTGGGDAGEANPGALTAHEGDVYLTLRGSAPFARASVGFLGASDGLSELERGSLRHTYATTGAARGAIMLTGELPRTAASESTYDFAIGFGADAASSDAQARGSLDTGYREVLARFNGEGPRVGWEDYLASLSELPRLRAASMDNGRLLQASAIALKVQEDHTYPGALIASLSNPWGDVTPATDPATGYKAVWPRDFYHCAMALAALGDRETPVAAFRYLPRVQVWPNTPKNRGVGGWFMQKSHVDGAPEWEAVQLDQTAYPIMLGWRLHALGLISDAEINRAYRNWLKPAADFLVQGGDVDIDWNHQTIRPPRTQQERWEEQPGYSPSTIAAVIAGLTLASDLATRAGDAAGARRFRAAADGDSASIERTMFTTNGAYGDGRYFVRIAPNANPNDHSLIESRNGQPEVPEDRMVDAGFLELVRYGVRRADHPGITESLPEIDDTARDDLHRIHYDFSFAGEPGTYPGWRRYSVDGYGDNIDNGNGYGYGGQMSAGQRGRVWPIFTGERGNYEVALAGVGGRPSAQALDHIRSTYVRAMELFANQGLMLSEQVWDGVGAAGPHNYQRGGGTDSATPLAWAHAEYITLLRSVADGREWDLADPVAHRYAH